MHALTADDVIHVWESGQRQDAADRAITALAAALPEKRRDELRHLSLGRRNALLLAVREQLFGSELAAFFECPGCGERLEFTFDSSVLRDALPHAADSEFDFEAEGYAVRFRLLDSHDLKAAAVAVDVQTARRLLVDRCVIHARRGAAELLPAQLPESVVERLSGHLAQCDPQAETLIALTCPACESHWSLAFDIASFCYTEIGALARRLLREVHILARAYAWRESDILAMSARRRQHYLEMLGQ